MRELVALVLFVLAIFGVANAVVVLKTRVVFEAIFGRVWVLRDLIKCPPCVAFWAALMCSRLVLSPGSFYCASWWGAMLLDGFAAVGAVWYFHVKAERLQARPDESLKL